MPHQQLAKQVGHFGGQLTLAIRLLVPSISDAQRNGCQMGVRFARTRYSRRATNQLIRKERQQVPLLLRLGGEQLKDMCDDASTNVQNGVVKQALIMIIIRRMHTK